MGCDVFRLFVVSVWLFVSASAYSQEKAIFLNSDNGGYIDFDDGQRFPIVRAIDGRRPADCPDGAFWSVEIEAGTILSECTGNTQYRVIAPTGATSWSLLPWPRPIDDDDSGPRME